MSKKLIYGVGINDADYIVQPVVNGRSAFCHFYTAWTGMLKRCYSDKYQAKQPTYKGCSVTPDWLTFSTFKRWMEGQDWEGKELDKDILVEGNKEYCPHRCVFVSRRTNALLAGYTHPRGSLPTGVKVNGKGYSVECNSNGRRFYLGTFDSVEKASKAYKEFKAEAVMEAALRQSNPRVQDALFLRSLAMAYQA